MGVFLIMKTKINLSLVIQKTRLPESQIIDLLQRLEKDEIISLQMANTDSEITFLNTARRRYYN